MEGGLIEELHNEYRLRDWCSEAMGRAGTEYRILSLSSCNATANHGLPMCTCLSHLPVAGSVFIRTVGQSTARRRLEGID